MRLRSVLSVSIAVLAIASVVAQAAAGRRSAIHLSGSYAVDTNTKARNHCQPVSKTNPAVLRCTVSGFVLDYVGSLDGRGTNTFRWVIDCTTGKSYTDGTETFTGSVEGLGSGTFSWAVRSTGTFDCKKAEVTGISAIENLYSSSGALAGLYGTLTRGPQTYSGMLNS